MKTPHLASAARAGDACKPLRIHIIAGGEYDPVPSMTEFKKYLEALYRVECTTSFYAGTGSPTKLENLDSLKSADVLVLFARRMALREEQMKLVRAHWEQGKPIAGVRTAGHACQKSGQRNHRPQTFRRRLRRRPLKRRRLQDRRRQGP
jgi:hypothetical protein